MSGVKDIFISYRREGGEFLASLLYQRLSSDGYSVFLDVESLRSGKFNEQLFKVIDECTDFLLILPPNGLNRCVHPDDWVRLEIERAVDCGKNIIPVMMRGFEWPEVLPEKLQGIPLENGVTANTELFDGVITRLEKKLLRSKEQENIPVNTKEQTPVSQQIRERWKNSSSSREMSTVMQTIKKKKEKGFFQEFERRNAEHNQDLTEAADCMRPEDGYSAGRHFSLYDSEKENTLVYRLVERYDEKLLLRYMEPDRLIRSSEQIGQFWKRTYYIPGEDIEDGFLSFIYLTFKDCGSKIEIYLNTGALSGWDVKLTKSPVLCCSIEKLVQSTMGYDLGNLTDAQKEHFERGYGEEKYYEEKLGPLDCVIIDPITLEEPRREVFFDENKKEFRARLELKSGYQYSAFYINMGSDTNAGAIPLTDIEIGSAYRTGSHGFPKDMMKAGEYLEKDSSADALYQIGLMFQNEDEIQDEEIAVSYFQRAADLGSEKAQEILDTLHII